MEMLVIYILSHKVISVHDIRKLINSGIENTKNTMNLIKNIILAETQRRSDMEIEYTIRIINKIYNEWKYKKRRKNAVDLITMSANKISNIHPSLIDKIHPAAKLKLATILMRCMDNPMWEPISVKEKIFKKLRPLLNALQGFNPQTGTDGTLLQIIATRLSACISYQSKTDDSHVFVAYEPKLPAKYLKYLFGDVIPCKTYRMQMLMLPNEFSEFAGILQINTDKCIERHSECE